MSRLIEVPEYEVQADVRVDPARTAVVVVDMQNDFVREGGGLLVPDAEATIPAIRALLELARAHGMRVVYSQDAHREGDPEWRTWPEHAREGSWGWEIVDELAPARDDFVLRKLRYDAFYGTPLDHMLRLWGVDTLVICGTVANISVQYTAASAALRWYEVVIPRDAISALDPFDLESSLRQTAFLFAGRITTAAALIDGPWREVSAERQSRVAAMTGATTGADREVPKVRVLLGTERYSSQHSWSELTALMPGSLKATVDVQWCPPGALAERARNESINVVVPLWAELDAGTIHAGQFGLIQQFGAGVENIDIEAATSAGVWVANMPGLNAVDVAEHAVLLLLALLRRLPESPSGFDPGHWGDPPGEELAGSTVCIVGLGAVGSQLARRLAPFEVRLIGVRRDVRRGAPPATPDMEIVGADRIHEALMVADTVILTASHEPGRPPLIDRAALAAMRPGGRLVNVARGALIDEAALLEALDQGRLAGAGLDVFKHEPYPASAPLAHHPKIIATAHNAALTTSYFRRAARALGEALAAQLDGRQPPNALNAPTQPRQIRREHRGKVAASSTAGA